MKLLVPAGYMVTDDHGRVGITVCSGIAVPVMTGMAMDSMPAGMTDHGTSKDHGKAEPRCAFAGLSAAALGAIDPIQLAVLIAFIMAIGLFGVVRPTPFASPYLRPPSHGPPATL